MKKLINKNTIILRDFNIPFTTMDRSSEQNINKETMALNDTLDQMNLTNVFKTLHIKATGYTFFSSVHGTFSRIDHILGHKSGLNNYKKIEITLCIFSKHNNINLKSATIKNFERPQTHGG